MNKYTVTVDGKLIGKRNSEGRIYTHVICGRYDPELARANAANWQPSNRDRHAFLVVCGYRKRNGKPVPTWEEWVAEQRAGRVSCVALNAPRSTELVALSWCGSYALAVKAAATFTGRGYRIDIRPVDQN